MREPRLMANLDPLIRRVLDRWLDEDRFTISECAVHLQKFGADLSKSTIMRYSIYRKRSAGDR